MESILLIISTIINRDNDFDAIFANTNINNVFILTEFAMHCINHKCLEVS